MNDFEKVFSKLRKQDDPRFLWINWMDWVIDQNIIAVRDSGLDCHGHEHDYLDLYLAWVDIVSNHLESTDDYYYDYLGVFFEEYLINQFNKKDDGQFFTPTDVSKLMSELVDSEPLKDDCFVYDCACGSARLLLDAHQHNPSSVMIGWDYDTIASRMAVLNFYIHGIRGSILRKNTLTGEFFEAWRVNNYLGYGLSMPHIEKVSESDAYRFFGKSITNTHTGGTKVTKGDVVNAPKPNVKSNGTLEAWL